MFQIRFGTDGLCPDCQIALPLEGANPFRCRRCRRKYAINSGTLMAHSKLSAHIWFRGLWLFSISKLGINASFVSRYLGLSASSAQRLLVHIRLHLQALQASDLLGGPGAPAVALEIFPLKRVSREQSMTKRANILIANDGQHTLLRLLPYKPSRSLRKILPSIIAPHSTITIRQELSYIDLKNLDFTVDFVTPINLGGIKPKLVRGTYVNLARTLSGTYNAVKFTTLPRLLAELEFRANFSLHPRSMFWRLVSDFPDINRFR